MAISEKRLCRATVLEKDRLRVSHGRTFDGARTTSRFTMHYIRRQCRRRAAPDSDRCWQHSRQPGEA